ncbi:MAG: Ig-like domain-containing protein [Treponema sp.]|jgi:hypothetical protein|nr:Ig-like domain-containing protein [Treponema sp.]
MQKNYQQPFALSPARLRLRVLRVLRAAASGLLLCAASGLLLCAALLVAGCPDAAPEDAPPAGSENGNGNGNGNENGNGPGQNPSGGVPIKRLTVSPKDASVVKGASLQFTALVEGTGEEKPDQSVVWSVIGEHDSQTAIDNAGLFTAAPGEAALALTIRAAAKADTGKFGSATVSLIDAPSVAQVTVEPQDARVTPGLERQFTAVVEVTGNADKTVVWSLSGNTQAGTLISASGLLTVAKTEPADTELIITATSAADGTKSGSAAARVTPYVPLPSLAGTYWWWPSLQLFFISEDRVMLYSTGAYYPYAGHPFKYTYPAPGYAYSYTYNPDAKTGSIDDLGEYSGGSLGRFRIDGDNQTLVFPDYKSYGHGADFKTLRPAPSPARQFAALPSPARPSDLNGTVWTGTAAGSAIGGYAGTLVIIHFTSASQVYVTRTYDVDTEEEKQRLFTFALRDGLWTIEGLGTFTLNAAAHTIAFGEASGLGSMVCVRVN